MALLTSYINKGQIISKGLLVSSNSPKKQTKEFIFTTTPSPRVTPFHVARYAEFHYNGIPQNRVTLEYGIDVGHGITVGPGKFVQKNKRRALNKRRS